MSHTPKPGASRGRVAIVEIAATENSPAVYAVEVVIDGETLTIADQNHALTQTVRDLTVALINQVRKEHNDGTN
jgi:hypothetical protein